MGKRVSSPALCVERAMLRRTTWWFMLSLFISQECLHTLASTAPKCSTQKKLYMDTSTTTISNKYTSEKLIDVFPFPNQTLSSQKWIFHRNCPKSNIARIVFAAPHKKLSDTPKSRFCLFLSFTSLMRMLSLGGLGVAVFDTFWKFIFSLNLA